MGSQRRPAHLSALVHECVDEAVYDATLLPRWQFAARPYTGDHSPPALKRGGCQAAPPASCFSQRAISRQAPSNVRRPMNSERSAPTLRERRHWLRGTTT